MNRRRFVLGAGASLVAATVARASGEPLSGPLALVTADEESHVAVVNLASGRVIRRIRTITLPRAIETVTGCALVAHSERGRLTFVDARTLTATLLPARMGEPRYVAMHPGGRFAFVTDSKRGEVATLDLRTGRLSARVTVGGAPRHLSLDSAGRRLWVALDTKAAELAVVNVSDPRAPRLARRITPPFLAHDVVFAPDGSRVWVTSGDRGAVALYDASSRRVVRRIDALASPQHVAFGPGGRAVYVASGDDGSMRVHRPDGELLVSSDVPVGSFNVTRAGDTVVTPSLERGTLCLLDRNGRVQRTVQIGRAAHDACIIRSV